MTAPMIDFRFIHVFCFVLLESLSGNSLAKELDYLLQFDNGDSTTSFKVLTAEDAVEDQRRTNRNSDLTPVSVTYSSNGRPAVLGIRTNEASGRETRREYVSIEWPDGQPSDLTRSFNYFYTLSQSHRTILNNVTEADVTDTVPTGTGHAGADNSDNKKCIILGGSHSLTTIDNLPLLDLREEYARYLGFQRVRITPFGRDHFVCFTDSGIWEHHVLLPAHATTTENTETDILISARLHLNDDGEPVWASFSYNSIQFTMTANETQEQELHLPNEEDEQDAQPEHQRNEITELPDPGTHLLLPPYMPLSAMGVF